MEPNNTGENSASDSPASNPEKILSPIIPDNLFLNFYRVSREEYSPAEGGCWFDYYQPLMCIPFNEIKSLVFPTRWDGIEIWDSINEDLTSHAKDLINLYAEETLGLTLESTMINGRKARPIYSAAGGWGRADARWHMEDKPFETMTTVWPHYE